MIVCENAYQNEWPHRLMNASFITSKQIGQSKSLSIDGVMLLVELLRWDSEELPGFRVVYKGDDAPAGAGVDVDEVELVVVLLEVLGLWEVSLDSPDATPCLRPLTWSSVVEFPFALLLLVLLLLLLLVLGLLLFALELVRLLKLEEGRLLRLYTPLKLAVLKIPELLSLLFPALEGPLCFGLALGSEALLLSLLGPGGAGGGLEALAGLEELLLPSSPCCGALGCSDVSCGSPSFIGAHERLVVRIIASTQRSLKIGPINKRVLSEN